MADDILDGTDRVGPLFGKRSGLSHQAGKALSQGIVEAFKVIGLPSVFRDGLMSSRRYHALVGFVSICMERGLFTVYQRALSPQLFGTGATPITYVKRDDLAGVDVHGDPNPLLVGLLLHKAPHLIGFGFQLPDDHTWWTGG